MMLESGHCAVHPSREAHIRCRICGVWMCERCAGEAPAGVFCSSACRTRFRVHILVSRARSLFTSPLDPQWTVAVTAALGALLLGAVGLLVVEFNQVSQTTLETTADQPETVSARIIETDSEPEFEVVGPPGARILVVTRSGQSLGLTLDDHGRARGPAAGFGDATVWIEGPNLPDPCPSPTAVPQPVTAEQASMPIPTPPAPAIAVVRPSPTSMPPASTAKPRTDRPRPAPTWAVQPSTTPDTTRAPAPPILHLVSDAGPRLAITFDGGASSNRTADLLDMLQQLDIKATLFLTGTFIRAQPALVRRAVLAGHEVGNHTDSHLHLTTYASNRDHQTLPNVTRGRLLDELERTEQAYFKATGRAMAPLWRAPYGEENTTLRRWAFEAGYLHVRWSSLEGRSLDTMDWIEDEHSPYFRDSRRMMDRLLGFPQLRGGIILMHLATDRDEPPWTHLPEFVGALRERSIEPVKVTTLLAESHIWRGWLERAAQRHAAARGAAPEPAQ